MAFLHPVMAGVVSRWLTEKTELMIRYSFVFLLLQKLEWDIFSLEIIFGKFLMLDPQLLEEFTAFILVGLLDLLLTCDDFL